MARIPLVEVDELTPAQRDAYDNKPGGKLNLSRLLAHAVSIQPGIGLAVQGMMTGIDVPPLERQSCVLAVLHLARGAYEWAKHLEVSKALGIAEEKVAAIARSGERRVGKACVSTCRHRSSRNLKKKN